MTRAQREIAMMTSSSFDQAVRALLERKPFQPFVIEFDEGERFIVDKPEALMFPTFGKTVFFRSDGSFDFVDNENVRQVVDIP
jgi:hypothetical protein